MKINLFFLVTITSFLIFTNPAFSSTVWNKNPNFNNYDGVDVSYTDTARGYLDFDWLVDWYSWTCSPQYQHRENRGWGLWSSDGKLTLDDYFDSNDPCWSVGGASCAFFRQHASDAPWGSYPGLTRFRVGDYPYSEIKGKYKLNRIAGLGAIENGIVNIWFEVESTYKGRTHKNMVGIDYYWFTSSGPFGIYNQRVDECDREADPNCQDILMVAMFAPDHWNGHNNWRSFPQYRYLYLIGMNAEIEGRNFDFYFDWEDLELVMIDNVAEIVPIVPSYIGGSGEIEITTDSFYVEKKSSLPISGGGGGGCGGTPTTRCLRMGIDSAYIAILFIFSAFCLALFTCVIILANVEDRKINLEKFE